MNSPPAARAHFHPLEIFPFFRRWPRSLARDLLYTFVWNGLFGIVFYAMGAFTGGATASLRGFAYYVLVANIVGYTIHFLFDLGTALGIDDAAHRSGFVAKMVYFTAVPLLGVLLGLWLASLFFDVGVRRIFTDLNVLLAIVSMSLVISTALCVVFFWRERSAVADAALARERERVERVERESVSANLRALQAQIEPHFLFNTLANVTSLIDSEPAKAKHMLETFIRFLRASLAATRTESTTIAAEADLIGSYLEVLQVRMGARLRGRVEVDPTLRAYSLPPMLLQPIVENAIRHGLEPKLEGGEVRVVARREGAMVAIDVIDTGVGFHSTTAGGLGLTNIRERLKLLYGDGATIEIRDHAPAGTVVTLRLPQ